MSELNFDASTVPPATGNQVIPAGDYTVRMCDSEMRDTKTGGKMLVLTFEVLDQGPYQGSLLWSRLNLVNANSKAVEIAQRELSAVCHAVGVLQVRDSRQLHDKPLKVRVSLRKAEGEYPESNEIKKYSPLAGMTPAQPAAASTWQAPAQAPAQSATAWQPPPTAAAPAKSSTPPWLAA